MAVVKVVSISSTDVEGKAGVRVEMASITPTVITRGQQFDEREYATDVAFGLMSGLQQAGLFPKVYNARLILFLTMEEYNSIGRPQINDVYEIIVSKNKVEFKETIPKTA
ncbi:MAG: arcadin 1 [Thermoproteota archaeon]|nr:arcadin 1 [Candidatus Brockarchaeota archaeon]MBO3768607.1 arcadin 1 [Candidatus Brockarchaeota archaeon]MBO3800901.1 arcadin 1 [Candidatus Brockarchaeota archaeon]